MGGFILDSDIRGLLKEGEIFVRPDDALLQYSGRLDYNAQGEPEMVFPCSFVKWHFRGTATAIIVSCRKFYWGAYAGAIVDGNQVCIQLEEGLCRIELTNERVYTDHVVTFFKRQDTCNIFTIHGIVLSGDSELTACPEKPERRIEVFGDSVSAGEVSEAVFRIGQTDPEGHEGCYSNSWYSYAWITARKLKAELHDTAQGGIPLMAGTGWFGAPELQGMEQIYDRVKYYPDIEKATKWDFSKYTPHVVIIAVGQNDAHPYDFMKEDYYGKQAVCWREHYKAFILRIRGLYPNALIICGTTILMHDEAWDRAIDEVVMSLNGGIAANAGPEAEGDADGTDKKIRHFLYTLNGKGTPGHIRIPEAEMMGMELSRYIESFGEEIWK